MTWPPPLRQDRFAVGDVVYWHIPTVMDHCRTWAPDITRPVTITGAHDVGRTPQGFVPSGHTQMVRFTPNHSPYSDEFSGGWFLPVGITTHNDPAFRDAIRLEQGT